MQASHDGSAQDFPQERGKSNDAFFDWLGRHLICFSTPDGMPPSKSGGQRAIFGPTLSATRTLVGGIVLAAVILGNRRKSARQLKPLPVCAVTRHALGATKPLHFRNVLVEILPKCNLLRSHRVWNDRSGPELNRGNHGHWWGRAGPSRCCKAGHVGRPQAKHGTRSAYVQVPGARIAAPDLKATAMVQRSPRMSNQGRKIFNVCSVRSMNMRTVGNAM